jgi:hypothetical protein
VAITGEKLLLIEGAGRHIFLCSVQARMASIKKIRARSRQRSEILKNSAE